MSTRILEPGQIESAAGDIPRLRLPAPGLFAARAQRLRVLAPGHSLGDFLAFAAALAECQQSAWGQLSPPTVPAAALLAQCRAAAMPPLAPPAWWPVGDWQALTRGLAADLAGALPKGGTASRLTEKGDDWLEGQARALLTGEGAGLDLAVAPFVGAALQVYWTTAASRLQSTDLGFPAGQARCPVCGSPPVASVLRIGGHEAGLRYLHCGLCASEWHVVRAKCSQCDNSRGVAYLSIEDPEGGRHQAVEAETCPECRGYLKLCRMDRDPEVDPWADDLATLALDLLVDQEGFERTGLNFLLLQGAPSG